MIIRGTSKTLLLRTPIFFPCGQAATGIMVLNIFLLKDSKCRVPCSRVGPFWCRVPPFCVCLTLKTFRHVERGQQTGGGVGEFRGRGAYGGGGL